ncbi:MAG: phosphoglycerate dehydrogenase [Anaerolineales bacterium]|nr:phosphoglycerate dehydrogenase [Anaerolineales bacterium]
MNKVLVTARSFGLVAPSCINYLVRNGFDVIRIPDDERPITPATLERWVELEQPQALVVGAEPITYGVINRAEGLRIITKHGVGVDNIDLEAATGRGVVVTNAPGTNNHAVADLTLCLMLSLSRQLCPANWSTKSGEWKRYIGCELHGKTIGVVGTGYIGKEVIKRAMGFGMQVCAYDVVADEAFAAKHGVQYLHLEQLLKVSDYISLHVPLIEQTRNMIGVEALARMKKTAFLINVSRGGVVDEQALYDALRTYQIAGAALDVFAAEPPTQSPLLALDNFLATPHMGGRTVESAEAMGALCADNIVRLFRGNRPDHIVNPQALLGFKLNLV